MTRLLFCVGLAAVMISCKQKADLILHNAIIYAEDTIPTASALAVSKGKIVAVGTSEDILSRYESDSILDAGQMPVYPGFIDAHCHFYGYALFSLRADLTGLSSWGATVDEVREFAAKNPELYWIRGRGWDQNLWRNPKFPNKLLLDAAFPDRPVLLTRVDGHAAVANSKALELAGITPATTVPGGKIVVENGQLTGLLIDKAVDVVEKVIPPLPVPLLVKALLQTQKECFALGLTTLHDAGLDRKTIKLIDSLQQTGQLLIRLNVMALPEERKFFFASGKIEKDRLRIGAFKVYADGALGSRGACLLEPYSDSPKEYGLMLNAYDSLKIWFTEMYANGFQVATHCIGDSAVRTILRLYAQILPPDNDRRWRIEHAQVVNPADLAIFKSYRIIPSVQPTHAVSDMKWAGLRLGERLSHAYAYQTLLQNASMLAMGSDFPVEGLNPLDGFHAAIARQNAQNEPTGGFQPAQALSRGQALLAMTRWAAFAGFDQDRVGSLQPGKWADFVILEQDIMKVEPSKIRSIKVLGTFVGGNRVY